MVLVHISVTALLLGNLHLGLGHQGEEARVPALQIVHSNPNNQVQQSSLIPMNYYAPNPRPVTYHSPHFDPLPQPAPRRKPRTDWKVLLAILYLSGAFGLKAATTTVTTANVACTYQSWGTCSAVCQGTQTRDVTCNGVLRTESRDCNTQLGALSGGWYRASNCYDYLLSREEVVYAEAQTACENLGGTLAQVGMRDAAVRREVVHALHISGQPLFAYIGLDRLDGNWEWLDDSTTVPDFWTVGEPDANFDCVVLVSGNPESASDANCAPSSGHFYYCEREAT